MRIGTSQNVTLSTILVATVFAATCYVALSQERQPNASVAKPLMKNLHLFSSPDVPALAPSETEAPRTWSPKPIRKGLPGKGMAQHPMLLLGEGYNSLMVLNHGKLLWTYQTGGGWEYDDAWMLSNGNILFTRMQYIAEVTPSKKVVWRYDAPEGTEIHGCQPIGQDKVLFIINGLPPKLIVMNIKSNHVEVEHTLDVIGMEHKWVHAEFRRVRYTDRGTYLVPYLEMNKVVEYDQSFNVVWQYDIPTPWAAVRLKNGNTLITNEKDVETREVTPKGETVWSIRPTDLPDAFRYENAQSATRLANGNTIICSRGGSHQGPQLVEVTPDKKVVWVLEDWVHFGPVTAVQILDEPGIPEEPGSYQY